MKVPEIKGFHKIRDAAICAMYEEWHDSELPKTEELVTIIARIGVKFGLKERRLQQILRTNHAYVPLDVKYEKKKRILKLKREIARAGNSKKDVADLMEQLRIEIEGIKIEHSGKIEGPENKIIIITKDNADNSERIPKEIRL